MLVNTIFLKKEEHSPGYCCHFGAQLQNEHIFDNRQKISAWPTESRIRCRANQSWGVLLSTKGGKNSGKMSYFKMRQIMFLQCNNTSSSQNTSSKRRVKGLSAEKTQNSRFHQLIAGTTRSDCAPKSQRRVNIYREYSAFPVTSANQWKHSMMHEYSLANFRPQSESAFGDQLT